MKYDPQIHHRRSIRLKGYDYSQAGAYYITICCRDMLCRFGNIVGAGFTPAQNTPSPNASAQNNDNNIIGQLQGIAPTDVCMELNEFGKIAHNEWIKLPGRFPNFELDVFQIMPNHMHGIIVLNDVGAGLTPAQKPAKDDNKQLTNDDPQGLHQQINDNEDRAEVRAGVNPAPTVGDIIGAYKSLVANECLKIYKAKNEVMGKLWQRNYHEHIILNEQSYQTISEYIINNPAQWDKDKFFRK